MRSRLGEKVGKAGDPGALADDIEEVTMFTGRAIGELAGGTRPRCGAGQPHEQRSTGIVLQIANDPVGAFPPSSGKVMTTNAFGMGRKLTQEVFCFQ